jgi:hypothetical protein
LVEFGQSAVNEADPGIRTVFEAVENVPIKNENGLNGQAQLKRFGQARIVFEAKVAAKPK